MLEQFLRAFQIKEADRYKGATQFPCVVIDMGRNLLLAITDVCMKSTPEEYYKQRLRRVLILLFSFLCDSGQMTPKRLPGYEDDESCSALVKETLVENNKSVEISFCWWHFVQSVALCTCQSVTAAKLS